MTAAEVSKCQAKCSWRKKCDAKMVATEEKKCAKSIIYLHKIQMEAFFFL
jgi:hypothetical protein